MAADEHERGAPSARTPAGARRGVPRRAPASPTAASVVIASPGAGAAPGSGFELLSRMGHELRSPLSAILGFAQILRGDDQSPLSGLQTGMVQQIEASGHALLNMVNDLVELSRIEAGRLTTDADIVDLVRLLRETAAQVAPLAIAGSVTLEQALPDCALTVPADRARLRHVLVNLLAHAVRYNRRGGVVRLGLAVEAGQAVVTVADTGGGLSSDTIEALFDPFARTTLDGSSLQGAGIGLLVARRMAQALGGTLALQVTPGVGTESRLSLPLAEPRSKADLPSNEQKGAPRRRGAAGLVR